MFGLRKRYALMDAAGDAGGAGGVGSAAGAVAGSAATGSAGAGAASLGGSAGGASGAAGAGGSGSGSAGAGAAASTLAGGAASSSDASTLDWLPEKYRVNSQDGSLDLSASAQKLASGYGELSKRFGDVGVAPKTAAEYQVAVPDALKEAVGDLGQDAMFTKFRDDMHGLGLTQKQFDGVMSRYFELAPALAQGGAQLSSEKAVEALKETWKDDGEFKRQVGLSYRAANQIAQAAGLKYEDIEAAGLGNNPTFIRLMAAIGPEFSEDTPPTNGASSFLGEDAVKELMMSEANTNPKHPNHKATRARIDAYYERKYGNQPIA